MELTATGIVTDSHRIPYYPWSVATDKDPFAKAKIVKKLIYSEFFDINFLKKKNYSLGRKEFF